METKLGTVLEAKGRQIYSIGPEAPVLEGVRRMHEHGVGALLVLDGEHLLGVFSERDVLSRVVAAEKDPASMTIRDVMTSNPVVTDVDTTVGEAMAIVTTRRFRHLPVVHRGALIGLLSSGDLTRWMIRNQRYEIEDLISFITDEYPR